MQSRWMLPLAAFALMVMAGLMAERVRPLGSDRPSVETQQGAPRRRVVFPRDRRRPLRPGRKGPRATPLLIAEPTGSPLDRFERAIALDGSMMMVAEVNAIRHSPLAEAILRCQGPEVEKGRAEILENTGIDVLRDVDRVMFKKDGVVMSGFFESVRLPEDLTRESYGDSGFVFSGEGSDFAIGQVGEDLLMFAPSKEEIEATIDRIEGRSPASLPESLVSSGGDLYGPIGKEAIRNLMEDSPLANLSERLSEATIQANVEDYVALSFDIRATQGSEELESMVKAALTAIRIEAARGGNADMVALLRSARVNVGDNGALEVDVPVPGEMVLSALECDSEGRPLGDDAE